MTASTASGSLAMIQPVWHYLSGSEDYRAGELYQTSLMSALTAGLYEGEVTYGEIRKHGDFGVGTFNELDGEMVGLDGTFYQLRADGSARPVTSDQKTPFAVVTFFKAEKELDLAQLEEIVLADKVGLDVFGVGEHHRSEFVDSAPAVILAAAATRTRKIRLTSAVTVLSAADPVRVFHRGQAEGWSTCLHPTDVHSGCVCVSGNLR